MTAVRPGVEEMKAQAKKLRRQTGMPYGRALDQVAFECGYRDWNVASAQAPAPDVVRPRRKLRNHVVLGIVLDYRFRDCMEPPDAITERFRKDYPDAIYDVDFFQNLIQMNPLRLARDSDYPNKWIVNVPDAFEEALQKYDPGHSWRGEVFTPQQMFRMHLNARRKSVDHVSDLRELFEGLDISNMNWK